MNTPELKILLALNGNQRLPHLEEEIFDDSTVTTVYLDNLCPLEWCLKGATSNAYKALCYSQWIVKEKWPAAEKLIATNPGLYRMYTAVFD